MDQNLLDKISSVRRQTRSRDIVDICDALEKFLLVRPLPVSAPEQIRPRFDKTTYQRELMRKRRARAKAARNPTD
jgi:hypothetical protein